MSHTDRPIPLPDASDPAVRARAVQAAASRRVHPCVLASIRADTPAQARSLEALARGACVVTGQQAGLFGGPLYTLHKAATAIAVARALEAETGTPCAPVFWIQDEDHDFDEIASIAALDASGERRDVRADGIAEEAGRSVGARRWGPSVLGALDGVEAALAGLPHAGEVMALLRQTHAPDATPADSLRAGITRLFGAHGLLVVDPWALPDAAAAVHARALAEAGPLADGLLAQGRALAEAGLPVPVHVRPGAPLCFVHPAGRDGPRVRVEPDERGGWRVCGSGAPIDASAIARGPHSTSALLRPILQDAWLPTTAYVGGPGERAYLAQLPPLWAAFGLPVPLVVPRARFALIDPACRRALESLGLTASDLGASRDALLARLGSASGDRPDPDALFASLTAGLPALEALGPIAEGLDPGLVRSVEKTASTFTDAASRLVDRYRRALAQSDAHTVDRLDRLLARLQPGGAPQERVFGWPGFAARVGIDALVSRVLDAVVPFDDALREVDL